MKNLTVLLLFFISPYVINVMVVYTESCDKLTYLYRAWPVCGTLLLISTVDMPVRASIKILTQTARGKMLAKLLTL